MTKSLLPLLFIFAIFSMSSRAQTVTIPENFEGVPGEQVSIPVIVDTDGDEICSFDFEIHYNNSVLDFIEVTGFQPEGTLLADDDDGSSPLTVGWDSGDNPGITVDDETLLYLVFDYSGQTSTLAFEGIDTQGQSALSDCSDGTFMVPTTFNNGSIIPVTDDPDPDPAPVPLSSWALVLGIGLMAGFVILRVVRP